MPSTNVMGSTLYLKVSTVTMVTKLQLTFIEPLESPAATNDALGLNSQHISTASAVLGSKQNEGGKKQKKYQFLSPPTFSHTCVQPVQSSHRKWFALQAFLEVYRLPFSGTSHVTVKEQMFAAAKIIEPWTFDLSFLWCNPFTNCTPLVVSCYVQPQGQQIEQRWTTGES